MSKSTVKVAVVQAEPEWLDRPATVKKTCGLIAEAAQGNAKLVAFPECWVPGYPCWIWSRPIDFELSTKYIENSLALDSQCMRDIQAAAKEHSVNVLLGFSENDHNSLYIAQVLIDTTGAIVMHRRKIKPTHMERTVFGDGSGNSLNNVRSLNGVGRVGALNCWEHMQPLLKYNTYLQHEEIHIAGWPPLFPHARGPGLWSMSEEGCTSLSQTYAVEGAAFVLQATSVLTEKGIERMGTGGSLFGAPGGGCSAVFGPDGRRLTEAMPATTEGLTFADLDRTDILRARCFVDAVGHYSRPDLLWLGADEREKKHKITHSDLISGSGEIASLANGVDASVETQKP